MTTTGHCRKRESSPLAKLPGVGVLLLFLLAFVGQASHSHLAPPLRAHAASHAVSSHSDRPVTSDAETAETCSLCVAMHSATAVSQRCVFGIAPIRAATVPERTEIAAETAVAFDRLSRPPPTLSRAV